MGHDVLLRGGTVVDGTGAARFTADVAVTDGRIADIGKITGAARRVIDATGLVVAPGVIDVHSHYDAQVCWDGPLLSSAAHGTTTVIQGNCGIGVAPCRPRDRDIAMMDLVVLEGISFECMKAGIGWEFETFPQYLDFLRKRGLGINLAAFVPLGPLRRYAIGDDANKRAATVEETAGIARALKEAMQAGAFGFSSTMTMRQTGYQGGKLPTQLADEKELRTYAGILGELGHGAMQVNVIESLSRPTDSELATLALLMEASGGKKVTYSGAFYRADDPEAIEKMLRKCEPMRQRGAMPQSTIMPLTIELDFRSPMQLADVEAFKEVLNRPTEDQKRIYSDPQWRARAKAGLAEGKKLFGTTWMNCIILRVNNPALRPLLNKTITQVASERGRDPFDVMLDVALEDHLELKILGAMANNDHQKLGQHIKDPRIMLGLHDGGAHVDQLFQAGFPTYMLGHWVREEKVIELEHAVRRMTSEPADYFNFRDRGRIRIGSIADLMVFDPATVGSTQPPDQLLNDLPGGGRRLYATAHGMEYVMVNGQVIVDQGRPTGALPGRILDGA